MLFYGVYKAGNSGRFYIRCNSVQIFNGRPMTFVVIVFFVIFNVAVLHYFILSQINFHWLAQGPGLVYQIIYKLTYIPNLITPSKAYACSRDLLDSVLNAQYFRVEVCNKRLRILDSPVWPP